MIMSDADGTSGKGIGTSDSSVGVQHWDPEEGTVCPFGSAVQVVVVSVSLLVVATMFEWAKRVQVAARSLDLVVSSEGFS